MKLSKSIILFLILTTSILSVTIVSASDTGVDDNFACDDSISATNYDLNNTQTILKLNHENHVISNDSQCNFKEKNANDNNCLTPNSFEVVKNNNSHNDKINVKDLINVNEGSNPYKYTINKTSKNTYLLTFEGNKTVNAQILPINDFTSFKKAVDYICRANHNYDAIVMDFKDNLTLNIIPWRDDLIKMDYVKNLIIRGFGATIVVNSPDEDDEYHFANVNSDAIFQMNNITIKGFNTAISNYGACQFNNVLFENNRLDYTFHEDYGGAIRNHAILNCYECSFINNYAKYGGAIYNEKGSQSSFFDCYFKNNKGYSNKGSKITTNDGNNIYSCNGASCLVINHDKQFVSININSLSDYNNLPNYVKKLNNVEGLIVNFTNPQVYNVNTFNFNFDNVKYLYINGHGATINKLNCTPSDENHFLKINPGQFYSIDNLTVCGFNSAIINQGSLSISKSTFKNNKLDYSFKKDYGGAIYNDEGLITISCSNFENNYAKYGGAIYNEKGIISCTNCVFKSNKAYANGGDIYNNKALLFCKACAFINSSADDKGGSIFTYYADMALVNVFFENSSADDGNAIYKDFGKLLINNCSFKNLLADEGKGIYNYGDVDKFSVLGNCYAIDEISNNINVTKRLDNTNDGPNEIARVTLRVGELVACILLDIVAGILFSPAAASIIAFIGGAALAGVEEVIEGVVLDHNFNIYNSLVMVVIAGAFDGAAAGLTSLAGKTILKEGGFLTTKFALKTAGIKTIQAVVGAALGLTGEALTEFLPRFDFNDNNLPTYNNQTSIL